MFQHRLNVFKWKKHTFELVDLSCCRHQHIETRSYCIKLINSEIYFMIYSDHSKIISRAFDKCQSASSEKWKAKVKSYTY
jgi:hypothetical protein